MSGATKTHGQSTIHPCSDHLLLQLLLRFVKEAFIAIDWFFVLLLLALALLLLLEFLFETCSHRNHHSSVYTTRLHQPEPYCVRT